MEEEKVRLGIIGMGEMGTKYAKMLLENDPNFLIVAITRIKDFRLESLKPLLNSDVKIYQSGEELIANAKKDLGVEAVLIVTPHYYHPTLIKQALETDLYVLCDKPVGVKINDVRPLFNCDTKKLGFIFQQREYESHKIIKQMIESKAYGDLKRFSYIVTDWYRTNYYYTKDSWRGSYQYEGGGIIINQCAHNIDFLVTLFGLPQEVRSVLHYKRYHEMSAEDEVTAYFEYQNQFNGLLVASTGETPGVNRLEISFAKALVTMYKDKIEVIENEYLEDYYRNLKETDIKSTTKTIITNDNNKASYLAYFKNFYQMIKLGESPKVSLEDAIRGLMLSNSIYLSGFTAQKVNIYDMFTKEEIANANLLDEEFAKRIELEKENSK